MKQQDTNSSAPSRRDFLKTSTALVGGTLASGLAGIHGAYAAGSDEIRVGLIGCGGRGTGAIGNAIDSAPGVRLVAMGDMFKDRLQDSLKNLEKYGDKIAVSPDNQFVGWDAYKKVVAQSDVNYVILATPPAFRSTHLRAAIEAGKNTFTEKPVAVDTMAIKNCLELAELSKSKNLAIVAGTQRRHQPAYLEAMRRVQDGAIGDVTSMRVFWNQGGLWTKPRQAEWTDMEWQLRNWLYFTWLSGDHIVEQHVHNLDVANWVMGGPPVRVTGVGGRQARTAPEYGNIYDHFGLDYEYASGAHVLSMCRQQPGTPGLVAEFATGTKGTCDTQDGVRYEIKGADAWKWSGEPVDPYVQEHTDLIASIRNGTPLNELRRVTESTLTAIAGREAAYTGKVVTLEQLMAAPFSLMPSKLEFGPIAVPPVAIPGQSQTM
jgi:myo-inositol 2-dehydrogenase / D-chiro-inositol 1-dehydrogenase